MKAVFSRRFRADLLDQETKYAAISQRLASAFRERVAGQAREIIKWEGGDHVGPHGFPCRRTRPFPFYIYYGRRGRHDLLSGSGPRAAASGLSQEPD